LLQVSFSLVIMKMSVARTLAVVAAAMLLGVEGLRHKPSQNSSLVHVADRSSMRVRQGIEQLEPWKDSGKALVTRFTEPELQSRVSTINGASYGADHRAFVGAAPSRFISNPGNKVAAEQIKKELAELGFAVKEQEMKTQTSYGVPKAGNIMGYIKGSDLSGEVVIFGAHYDSVNWHQTTGAAPGADDNGSGIAALLEVARTVAAESQARPLRRSVLVVAFQAEEVGLFGSKTFVSNVLKHGDYGKPVATIIADEVSYPGRPAHSHRAIFETKGRSPGNVALIDTMAHQAQADNSIAGWEVNYAGFGSDHIPFLEAGYPTVLLIERDNMYFADTWGHSSNDGMQNTDEDFGAAMTRLAARTILAYASPHSQ